MTQTQTTDMRRNGPPPLGLAVIQRQGSNQQGDPFHVKVVVASVVVNGYPLNNNLVALLVGQAVERMMRTSEPVLVAARDMEQAVDGGDANGRH